MTPEERLRDVAMKAFVESFRPNAGKPWLLMADKALEKIPTPLLMKAVTAANDVPKAGLDPIVAVKAAARRITEDERINETPSWEETDPAKLQIERKHKRVHETFARDNGLDLDVPSKEARRAYWAQIAEREKSKPGARSKPQFREMEERVRGVQAERKAAQRRMRIEDEQIRQQALQEERDRQVEQLMQAEELL